MMMSGLSDDKVKQAANPMATLSLGRSRFSSRRLGARIARRLDLMGLMTFESLGPIWFLVGSSGFFGVLDVGLPMGP